MCGSNKNTYQSLLRRRRLSLWLFWGCFLSSRNRCLRLCWDGSGGHRPAAPLGRSLLVKKKRRHNTEAVSRDSWFSCNSNSAYLGHLSLLFNGNRRRLPCHLLTPRGRGKRSLRGAPSALGRHVNGRPPPIENFMKRLRSRIPTLTFLGVIMCIVSALFIPGHDAFRRVDRRRESEVLARDEPRGERWRHHRPPSRHLFLFHSLSHGFNVEH